jgi:hypothetical protein
MGNFLGFQINVLSRIEFDSIAIPFADRPALGFALKRRGKRVTANHILQSAWTRNLAVIQNNTDRLAETDAEAVLEDAYIPGYKLKNPSLRKWFGEIDAWWFDNVHRNLEKFDSPYVFSIAASLAMDVGDYLLSFDESDRELRSPLSTVYKRLWKDTYVPINNSQNNSCQNKTAIDFISESFVDLLFLQIPSARSDDRRTRWREEWIRGGEDFWPDVNKIEIGRLGSNLQTRSQTLRSIEETLSIASNIKHWAIEHSEPGLVSTQDIIDIVNKLRRVDKIYTKDFSELTGIKASIITA